MKPEEFVYRERELAKLEEAYGNLGPKGFQVRLIVGEAGTGKTVLLDQFTDLLLQKDENVLITGCSCTMAGALGEDYQPFKDILQTIISEIGSTQANKQTSKEKWTRVFGASANVLLKVAPDLIENFVPMGTLITSIGGKVLEETGLQQRVDQMRTGNGLLPDLLKLADQYVEVLKLIAGRYRLVIYIDNLQWADRASLELLQRLYASLRRLPLMLIGCYRSADMVYISGKERHPLEAFVTHMKVSCGDVFVDLDTGCRESMQVQTCRLLELEKVNSSPVFQQEIQKRTGGNPLFVRELVRIMKENGSLKKRTGADWTEAERIDWEICPIRIEGVVREKVAALEEDKFEILACAAIQGPRFLMQVVARMTGKDEAGLLDCLTGELGRQRHLVYEGECFRLGEELMSPFYFSDSFLRNYLYRGLGPSKRMLLHGKAARILEEFYAGRTEEVSVELAYHYECSGETGKAVEYLFKCISRAESEADYIRMTGYVRTAKELLGKNISEEQCRHLALQEVNAMRRSGRVGLKKLTEALNGLEKGMEEEKKYAGLYFWELWNIGMLKGNLKEGWKLAVDFTQKWANQPDISIYGLVAEAIASYWSGDFKHCRSLMLECREYYAGQEQKGELFGLVGLYGTLVEFHIGEYEKADEQYRQFYQVAKTEENRVMAVLTGIWLAFLDEDMAGMQEGMKKLGQVRYPGYWSYWLELFRIAVLAETEVWKGLELLKEHNKSHAGGYGVTLYGLIVCRLCFTRGLYEVFDELWTGVMAKAEKTGEQVYTGELYLLKGRCLEGNGDTVEAYTYIQKSVECMEKCGENRLGLMLEL